MASAAIIFDIIGKDRASEDFKRVGNQAERTGDKLRKMGRLGKVAALGIVGAATGMVGAAGAAGVKLYQMGDAAGDSSDRINQVAKSMGLFGDKSGQVTNRLVKLANATARNTGVDQNQIKLTQAKLLTFGALAKSADKAGGSFDRATQAAIDMGAAGFGDAASNAVQLGKALNDPIKGITALSKSGITFTDTEKARIAAMVKAGDTAKAQGLILKAIEAQVGGVAAAQAGPMDRLKATASQAGEAIGQKLQPMVDNLATKFLNDGLPALMKFGSAMSDSLGPKLREFGDWFQAKGLPAIKQFAGWLSQNVPPAFERIKAVASLVFANLKQVIGGNMGNITATIQSAISIIKSLWSTFGPSIIAYIGPAFENAKRIIGGAFKVIRGLFQTVAALLKGDWSGVWRGLVTTVQGLGQMLVGAVRQLWNLVKLAFSAGGAALKGIFTGAWNGLVGAAKAGGARVVAFVQSIPGRIVGAIGDLGTLLAQVGRDVISGLVSGIKSAASGMLKGALNSVTSMIPSYIKKKLDSHSPSRVMIPIGESVPDGLAVGIKKRQGSLAGVAERMTLSLAGGIKKGMAKAKAAIDRAQTLVDKFREKMQTIIDFRNEVAGNAMGSLFEQAGQDGPLGIGQLLANATAKVQAMKDFVAKITQLRQAGLNNKTLQELIGQGAAEGGANAAAILSGGAGAIGQFNANQAALEQAAGALGDQAALSQYGMTAAQAQAAQNAASIKKSGVHVTVNLQGFAIGNQKDMALAIEKAFKVAARSIGRPIQTA